MRRYIIALLLSVIAHQASAAEVEAFAALGHTSNMFRGRPINDRDALQLDGLEGGVTITVGKHRAWEIDLVHGVQRIDGQQVEQFSAVDVRFYPGRLR